ncbi:hypothetical protein Ga0074812_14027 [Parafrankia irregularis]|uniref:Uncharacterized protein n=1 Tax=Parafrankia irregularis TaxID=795642 RepID=A0A0S4QY76_9ACTN|nr:MULTISPECIES: hypothetical protein [Parafrankia]MBE3203555.1 hypothetical protein [Parafrankia sp. CH37]CUU60451.1 hypothetical protein Ga0074812_14027 [Parafrankia irregularis]
MTALAAIAAPEQTTPATAGPFASALRLAADLIDHMRRSDPDIRVSVSAMDGIGSELPEVRFLFHGTDRQALASLSGATFTLDVPVTVSDPSPALDDGVWVGGFVVRDGVTVTFRTGLHDPEVIAHARRMFPDGTGGW